MDGAHDVCRIRLHRMLISVADDGLGRHVDHNLRLRLAERLHQMIQIAHIAPDAAHFRFQPRQGKEARLGWRLQRIPRHLRPGVEQHAAQPASLESRMSRYQHAPVAVKG